MIGTSHKLRDYQGAAVTEIRAHYAAGRKRALLWMPTGTGKTTVFSYILRATNERGWPAIMVVRGRKLVDQASQRLIRDGVEHGVTMANHWLNRPYLKTQICSVDTLLARNQRPEARLVVIDEAHMATSDGYLELLKAYPDAFFLSVTATPYTKRPLRHLADAVVRPISFNDAVAQGYLVPPRYFCPSHVDLTGVRVDSKTGDYVQGELARAVDKSFLVGDIVEQWKKHARDRPSLAFAVSKEHSRHITEAFLAAGIRAEHVDESTKEREREDVVRRLESGQTQVVSNVGILCTGVDIPVVGAVILARPTKSYCLYVQQIGRGTRPFAMKNDFMVLDHGDNVARHGFVEDEPEPMLQGNYESSEPRVFICRECFTAFREKACPGCGWVPTAKKEESSGSVGAVPEALEGELVQKTKEEIQALKLSQISRRNELRAEARENNYSDGWVWHQLKKQYGAEVAGRLTNDKLPPWMKSRRT